MKLFDVDWDKLNLLLLPTFLRKKLLYAFLHAVTKPIWTIYSQFRKQRAETLFLLKYDTSKRNVELVLQQKFESNGIYIVNNNDDDNCVYLSDNEPDVAYLSVYLSEQGYVLQIATVYLDNDTYLPFYIDAESPTFDFTIMVPADVYAVYADDIANYAKLFTLPGMIFNVKPIN